ncbi:DUF1330 domain-containing protein [Spirosoma utsteinense]|nr:DUF1330 domain-containing protein [Spirosoma utsteinense]MBC3788295.1 putative protein (DUF1330 family) [Spirosoma utsteinense]
MENQTMPKGYLIATFTIHDQAMFQKYAEAGKNLAAKFNGRVILSDSNPKILEGKSEAIIVVVEFATHADAERCYHSPEYTIAKQFRIAATTSTIILAEGLTQ